MPHVLATMNVGAIPKAGRVPPVEALFHLTISKNLRHASDACALAFCFDVVKWLHHNEICGDARMVFYGFEHIICVNFRI